MASENEPIADILEEIRGANFQPPFYQKRIDEITNRIEAAWKREHDILRSCARWILTHDIYGHMSQELLAECKKALGDDGKFLMTKGDMA